MNYKNQQGMASIMVVGILVILLTLVSLGFARLMNRSIGNFVNQQQNSSASYATQTGLNDILFYMRHQLNNNLQIDSNCDNLFAAGGFLSGDNNISDSAQYNCSILTPTPDSLVYQKIPPNRSQVVKLTTCTGSPCVAVPASQLMFSWQSSDRSKDQFFPSTISNFTNETSWNSSNYAPILRLALYPVPLNGQLDATQSNSKTFFLAPSSLFSGIFPYSWSDGSIVYGHCDKNHYQNQGSFQGTRDYDCGAVITGLSTTDHYYAVLTPLYGQADIKIKASNSTGTTAYNFGQNAPSAEYVQAVIDVTGTSNGLSKRLQARANISKGGSVDVSDNNIPDQALRSASAICKRLNIDNVSHTIYVDGSLCTAQLPIVKPALVCSGPSSVPIGSPGTFSATGGGAGYKWSKLTGTFTPPPPLDSASATVTFDWANSQSPPTASVTVTDKDGQSNACPVTVTAVAPSVVTGAATNRQQNSATLNGTVNPHLTNLSACFFKYGLTSAYGSTQNCTLPWPGAVNSAAAVTANLSGLISGRTYHYQLCATNASGNPPTCGGVDRTTLPPLPVCQTPLVYGSNTTSGTYLASFTGLDPSGGSCTGATSTSWSWFYDQYGDVAGNIWCGNATGGGSSFTILGGPFTGRLEFTFTVRGTNDAGTRTVNSAVAFRSHSGGPPFC